LIPGLGCIQGCLTEGNITGIPMQVQAVAIQGLPGIAVIVVLLMIAVVTDVRVSPGTETK